MRNATFLVAATLALTQIAVGQKAATSVVTVTVVDESDAIVPEAVVEVHHWAYNKATGKSDAVQDGIFEPDSHGKVTLDLPPGRYDLSASWAGLLPDCRRVTVKKSNKKKLDVTMKLKYDRTLKPAGG